MCWQCANPTKTQDDYLREVVLPCIERCGWMVQAVLGSRAHAPFAYTVGLTGMGLPELLVTGLSQERAAVLLNLMAEHWRHTDRVVAHGEQLELLDGRLLEVVDLPHPEAHVLTAGSVYGDAVRAQQLVWADDRGCWPWDARFRGRRGGQPVLGPRGP